MQEREPEKRPCRLPDYEIRNPHWQAMLHQRRRLESSHAQAAKATAAADAIGRKTMDAFDQAEKRLIARLRQPGEDDG
jgi:hypothetical protein